MGLNLKAQRAKKESTFPKIKYQHQVSKPVTRTLTILQSTLKARSQWSSRRYRICKWDPQGHLWWLLKRLQCQPQIHRALRTRTNRHLLQQTARCLSCSLPTTRIQTAKLSWRSTMTTLKSFWWETKRVEWWQTLPWIRSRKNWYLVIKPPLASSSIRKTPLVTRKLKR